jgi:hypothetical protein
LASCCWTPRLRFADRWKVGYMAGYQNRMAYNMITGQQDGYCHWSTYDTGTNQCRYKAHTINGVSGCWWAKDGGTNQCTPTSSTPPPTSPPTSGPWAPKTFSTSGGTFTVTPYDDGDGNAYTMAGTVRARYYSSDDDVTFRVRIQTSPTDLQYVGHVASSVTGIDYTDLTSLPGNATYPTIYRYAGSSSYPDGGWQTPQPTPTPTPSPFPGAPPTGATCYMAWSQYQSMQMQCFAANIGVGFIFGLQESAWSAGGAMVGCRVVSGFTLAQYATCVAGVTLGSFAENTIRQMFTGTSQHPACNALDFLRAQLSFSCPNF